MRLWMCKEGQTQKFLNELATADDRDRRKRNPRPVLGSDSRIPPGFPVVLGETNGLGATVPRENPPTYGWRWFCMQNLKEKIRKLIENNNRVGLAK